MELWHLVAVCGRLLWVELQLRKERGRWVGKSKERLEPARMRWDPHDRLQPTPPTDPNFSDESGLQVKLSPLAQSWTLNPGTGAEGVLDQAPALINRRASREQRHGWAEGLQAPCTHLPSQPENCSFTLPGLARKCSPRWHWLSGNSAEREFWKYLIEFTYQRSSFLFGRFSTAKSIFLHKVQLSIF